MKLFSKKTAAAETHLQVVGMNCGACQAHVSKALEKVPGVQSVKVDLKSGAASVSGDAQRSDLVQAIEKAGYSVSNP